MKYFLKSIGIILFVPLIFDLDQSNMSATLVHCVCLHMCVCLNPIKWNIVCEFFTKFKLYACAWISIYLPVCIFLFNFSGDLRKKLGKCPWQHFCSNNLQQPISCFFCYPLSFYLFAIFWFTVYLNVNSSLLSIFVYGLLSHYILPFLLP